MDDIDSNDDDWTRSDETFDYNKKIDRYASKDVSLIVAFLMLKFLQFLRSLQISPI